ncbi:MAG: CRISPR-associated endonuclease Cas2 [Planctomycetota bacterium]
MTTNISEYKAMWLFAMFDLPVVKPIQRKRYTQFRKGLLKEGFIMLQYSVYARHCPSEETSDAYRNIIEGSLPPEGEVRLIAITDRQFAKMQVFYGEKTKPVEKPPPQLLLF